MLEKSANCISTIGRMPSIAAPIAVPTIASSLMGVFENVALRPLDRVLRKQFLFHLRRDVAGVVVLAVSGEAQDRGNDQLRRPARARAFHRRLDGRETRREIGAVDRLAFVAVTDG